MFGLHFPAETTAFSIVRCTTDKLGVYLNGFGAGWNVEQVTHTGGRDWVIIASFECDTEDEKDAIVVSEGYEV